MYIHEIWKWVVANMQALGLYKRYNSKTTIDLLLIIRFMNLQHISVSSPSKDRGPKLFYIASKVGHAIQIRRRNLLVNKRGYLIYDILNEL